MPAINLYFIFFFPPSGPLFDLSITSDTTSVYPWETVKIDCIISVSGTSDTGMHICFGEKIKKFLEKLLTSVISVCTTYSYWNLQTTWQCVICNLNKMKQDTHICFVLHISMEYMKCSQVQKYLGKIWSGCPAIAEVYGYCVVMMSVNVLFIGQFYLALVFN